MRKCADDIVGLEARRADRLNAERACHTVELLQLPAQIVFHWLAVDFVVRKECVAEGGAIAKVHARGDVRRLQHIAEIQQRAGVAIQRAHVACTV